MDGKIKSILNAIVVIAVIVSALAGIRRAGLAERYSSRALTGFPSRASTAFLTPNQGGPPTAFFFSVEGSARVWGRNVRKFPAGKTGSRDQGDLSGRRRGSMYTDEYRLRVPMCRKSNAGRRRISFLPTPPAYWESLELQEATPRRRPFCHCRSATTTPVDCRISGAVDLDVGHDHYCIRCRIGRQHGRGRIEDVLHVRALADGRILRHHVCNRAGRQRHQPLDGNGLRNLEAARKDQRHQWKENRELDRGQAAAMPGEIPRHVTAAAQEWFSDHDGFISRARCGTLPSLPSASFRCSSFLNRTPAAPVSPATVEGLDDDDVAVAARAVLQTCRVENAVVDGVCHRHTGECRKRLHVDVNPAAVEQRSRIRADLCLELQNVIPPVWAWPVMISRAAWVVAVCRTCWAIITTPS